MMTTALHPDLKRYIIGTGVGRVLRHPLVTRPIPTTRLNAVVNRIYESKLERLRVVEATEDWESWLWLHEKEFRPKALIRIAKHFEDDQYWRMVARTWQDADVIHPNLEEWLILWGSNRQYRESMFRTLPEPTWVYRGTGTPEGVRSLSWTTDPDLARKYALQAGNEPQVASMVANEKTVRAYFRKRQEVIILPQSFGKIRVRQLDRRTQTQAA